LSFIACDVMGNVLGSKRIDNAEAGDHQETLTLSRKPIGNAVLFNIESGEEKQSEKVYQ